MKLKEYFQKSHHFPTTLANECKVSVSSMYNYLSGKRPSLKVAKRIEKVTNQMVTVQELLEGESHGKRE